MDRLRRLLPFFIPFLLIVGVGIGVRLLWFAPAPRGEPADVEVSDIDGSMRFVRVTGMAHYSAVIKQKVDGGLFAPDRTLYLFPLFGRDDIDGRAIRVLVRTARPPEKYVSYETMTVEGALSIPTADQVPFQTEIILGKRSDYFFDDGMLMLTPWRITSEGEVWEAEE